MYISKETAFIPGFFVKPKSAFTELRLADKRKCMLCGRKETSEKLYGPLYKLDNVVVHFFCIVSK